MRPRCCLFVAFLLGTPPAASTPELAKLDQYGDPLPAGAVARLGKVWFAGNSEQYAPVADGKSIRCLRHGIYLLTFDRQTGKLIETATLPTEPCANYRISADGRRAVLLRGLNTPKPDNWEVWDLDRRKLVTTIHPDVGHASLSIAFGPDGRRLVAFAEGTTPEDFIRYWPYFWNADTGERTGKAEVDLPFHVKFSGWRTEPKFSADGQQVLIYSGQREQLFLIVFDMRGQVLWQRLISHKDSWNPVEVSGHLLLPGASPGQAIKWADGSERTLRMPADFAGGEAVAPLRGGKSLLYRVAVGTEYELRAWDVEREAADPDVRPYRTNEGSFARGWPSGKAEVVFTDKTTRLLDLKIHRLVGPDSVINGHPPGYEAPAAIAFSADGTRLVTVGGFFQIKLWDTATGRTIGDWTATTSPAFYDYCGNGGTFGGPGPPAFALSADGRRLVFAELAQNGNPITLRVVEMATGRTLATRPLSYWWWRGQPSSVGRLSFADDNDTVYVSYGNIQDELLGTVHDLARWKISSDIWQELGTMPMSSVARGASGRDRWLISGAMHSARTSKRILQLVGAAQWGFTLTADGRLAAGLGRADGPRELAVFDPVRDIRVWDARTGEPIVHLASAALLDVVPWASISPELIGLDNRNLSRAAAIWPRRLALHPSGRLLVTSDIHGVRLWDLLTGRVIHTFPVPFPPPIELNLGGPATALAFNADGSRLATGQLDGTILIWTVPRPAPMRIPAAEKDGVWADLMGPDVAKGWRAAWRLMEDPATAIQLLRANLRPTEAVSAAEVSRLLADVDAPDFRRREAATRRLTRIVDQVGPAVADAERATNTSPELRERLRKVLAAAPSDDRALPTLAAAHSRAVAVLEYVRSPESIALLRELAGGAPGAWLTREAEAALERMGLMK